MAATRSVGSSLMLDSTSFPQVQFSFLPKRYKEVNMKWALQMRQLIDIFQQSLTSYMTEDCLKPWLEFLHHMHLFIREESIPQYDQTVLTLAEKQGINTTCVCTAEDSFKNMRKDSYLQNDMKFLYHAISIFKWPLKNVIWIHDIRTNVQEKFKIRTVQMSFRPELHMCECEKLKQREQVCCHDFLHEIITNYKNNQVNAWFRKNTRGKSGVNGWWFQWKPSTSYLVNLE